MTYYSEVRKNSVTYRFGAITLRMLDELVAAAKEKAGPELAGVRITRTSIIEWLIHQEHGKETAAKAEISEVIAESNLTVSQAMRILSDLDKAQKKGKGSRRKKEILACKTDDTSQLCSECGADTCAEGAAYKWQSLTGEIGWLCKKCDRKRSS